MEVLVRLIVVFAIIHPFAVVLSAIWLNILVGTDDVQHRWMMTFFFFALIMHVTASWWPQWAIEGRF